MKTGFGTNTLMALLSLAAMAAIGLVGIIVAALLYFSHGLPDYSQLANYQPPIVTRAYASDGRLLAEFATEKRVFVPIETVPPLVIHAFISAEDKNFYTHPGVDVGGIFRAIATNMTHVGRRKIGASTITQQVAKNFLLGNEVSYSRKIREMILSFRIEKAYTKNQILQLYLNEIFMGQRSYGVAAAALEYFNKPLNELTIEEAAFLGALPKGPNNYSPDRHYEAALARRNWVIAEMIDNGYVDKSEGELAMKKPITVVHRDSDQYVDSPYFAEEVRRKLMELYGDKGLYEGGLIAHTTLIPDYQKIAEKALRNGLIAYDMRYGLHSAAVAHIDTTGNWQEALGRINRPAGMGDFVLGVILDSNDKKATVGLTDGSQGVIPFDKMKWTRKAKVNDLLKAGDVWMVEKSATKEGARFQYWLRQIPNIAGGIIVMDPHTGRIFAVAGGFSYELSQFDRATQAIRQPGSAFKPFVYLTALEQGFTPATLVLDAPFVFDQGPGLDRWRPKNYHDDFEGPVPMRIGMEKSRNLMTIRLASYIGMDKISATAQRFGVIDNMPPLLSMSVGAGETTLLKMVAGYSSFVNGGLKVTPNIIDRVQDRDGKTLYVNDGISTCGACGPLLPWNNQAVPDIADKRQQVADPRNMYQIVSMLEGVVQRGTATLIRDIGRPVAGKTGTTNDSKDTWFIGFTPDIIVGVYVGFDEPKPMGKKETGGSVAVPVVREFMEKALKGVSPVPFRIPEGIRLVQVNELNGTRAKPGDTNVILDAFVDGNEPGDEPTMWTGAGINPVTDLNHAGEGADTGLGGIY